MALVRLPNTLSNLTQYGVQRVLMPKGAQLRSLLAYSYVVLRCTYIVCTLWYSVGGELGNNQLDLIAQERVVLL